MSPTVRLVATGDGVMIEDCWGCCDDCDGYAINVYFGDANAKWNAAMNEDVVEQEQRRRELENHPMLVTLCSHTVADDM